MVLLIINNSNMSRLFFAVVGLMMLLTWSCGSNNGKVGVSGNAIVQEADGTLELSMDDATCYSDEINPASNTAEWNVFVSKPGSFRVWLSSATKDTTRLNYNNSVKLSLLDKFLEITPACDKVIHDSKDVSFPYYRADSYMGSLYISEPGEYSIQVISEKVLPKEAYNNIPDSDHTRLMSVILSPMTR